jgi:hypothetical protein
MKCDLENSFLLVYLSGPLIITHEPWGAALADPPLLVGLVQLIDGRTSKKENNMSLLMTHVVNLVWVSLFGELEEGGAKFSFALGPKNSLGGPD